MSWCQWWMVDTLLTTRFSFAQFICSISFRYGRIMYWLICPCNRITNQIVCHTHLSYTEQFSKYSNNLFLNCKLPVSMWRTITAKTHVFAKLTKHFSREDHIYNQVYTFEVKGENSKKPLWRKMMEEELLEYAKLKKNSRILWLVGELAEFYKEEDLIFNEMIDWRSQWSKSKLFCEILK